MKTKIQFHSARLLALALTLALGAKSAWGDTTYYWIGNEGDSWNDAGHWSLDENGGAANTYPGENNTEAFTVVFTKDATFASSETVDISGTKMTVKADGYSVKLPKLTVTAGTDSVPATTTVLESGTIRFAQYARHRVMVESAATLVIDQDASGSSTYYREFMGTGTIIVDGATINGTSGYGAIILRFAGTLKFTNGAKLVTTSNSQATFTDSATCILAGATIQKDAVFGQSHAFGGNVQIEAGTANVTQQSLPLDKTAIVMGANALDTDQQYVLITADAYTGTLPTVADELVSAGWDVIRSTNGDGKTILVLTHNQTYTWTGAAGDSLWATPENWIVGGYVPATAPGAGDTVEIEDATVSVEKDAELGVVTLSGTAKLSVIGVSGVTTATTVLPALAEGSTTLTSDNVEIVGPYAVSIVDGAVQATREAATFIWNGGESGAWTASSWKIGETAVLDYPTGKDDMAIFNDAAQLTVADNTYMSQIALNANLQLTSSSTVYAGGDITGTGTLILSNVTLRTHKDHNKTVTFSSPVNVPKDATAKFQIYAASSDSGYKFTLSGKLTGEGTIDSSSVNGSNSYSGLNLTGDGSDFAGTVKLYSNSKQQRDAHVINPSASSSNAIWRINVDGSNNYLSKMPFVAGTSSSETYYYFGACAIDFKGPNEGVNGKFTLEVGALDQDSTIYTSVPNSDKSKYGNNTVLKWIAPTATITNAVPNLHTLDIAGGGVAVVASSDLPQRIKFTGKGGVLKFAPTATTPTDLASKLTYSDVDIVFDDEGESYTWATALDATNKGGLVKKGKGTLVLGAAPEYKGETVLNGGTLKIPKAADVAVKTTAADSMVVTSTETIDTVEYTVYTLQTLEKPTADENGVIQIPASMSGQYAAYALDAGQSLDCSLLTDASGIKAVVTTTVGSETVDITSYYTTKSLEVNSDSKMIVPQLADSVQVGFADDESTEAAVVTVEEGSVKSTFTLPGTNVKKGLYYSVGTVTNPAAADSTTTDFLALAEQQATADNQAISLDAVPLNFGTGNVLYYKWSVSDTPQVATP